jgi:sugar/nucleoside kinase (ribokinase family)
MAISPPPEREGASNAFNGAFAMAITQGDDFSEASVSLARQSLRKGTRRGDQKSMPSP